MKKIISVILCLCFAAGILSACATDPKANENKEGEFDIVCTIFPVYDWVCEITKNESSPINIRFLLDNRIDLHNYQPTAEDMIDISECDAFIYVGGESDEWVEDALKNVKNKDMIVINLMEILGDNAKKEEAVEGMETEDEGDEDEYDEHIWLSLKNAEILVSGIADRLKGQLDTSYSKAYIEELRSLDSEYESVVNNSSTKTIVIGDRFPFRYMMDDYGIEYFAAFSGCSAETEASFETISFLAGKVDELKLNYVVALDESNCEIALAVIDNTAEKDQQLVTMDSMQDTNYEDIESGASYLSIMNYNLESLREVLR